MHIELLSKIDEATARETESDRAWIQEPQKILIVDAKKTCLASSIDTKTTMNFLVARYKAIEAIYQFLTPDQWADEKLEDRPFVMNSVYLGEQKKITVMRVNANLDS
jgi:hypothetical protein